MIEKDEDESSYASNFSKNHKSRAFLEAQSDESYERCGFDDEHKWDSEENSEESSFIPGNVHHRMYSTSDFRSYQMVAAKKFPNSHKELYFDGKLFYDTSDSDTLFGKFEDFNYGGELDTLDDLVGTYEISGASSALPFQKTISESSTVTNSPKLITSSSADSKPKGMGLLDGTCSRPSNAASPPTASNDSRSDHGTPIMCQKIDKTTGAMASKSFVLFLYYYL